MELIYTCMYLVLVPILSYLCHLCAPFWSSSVLGSSSHFEAIAFAGNSVVFAKHVDYAFACFPPAV